MGNTQKFKEEYAKLNKAQKEAVDTIDGPVMVVAGPGTGKTQILALRIGNILKKTDIKGDGILCLTFTNSAVEAMQERLKRYIGETALRVNVFTFHSFGMKIIQEYFKVLGLKEAPGLLEDTDRAILFDQIISENDWEYLRPRGNNMRYFQDLKSLISLMKRERISDKDFVQAVESEINFLQNDDDSLSTRGSSKGEIKKEVEQKIEGLKKSGEIVKFLNLYETAKKNSNLLDYDDVLESLVKIVEVSKEARSSIKERYLYVLVDEHQDSSRVQNEFLSVVWGQVERPDIFVVGDDRQLIYGFSGASIEHFAGFKKTFQSAKLITLTDNYRSTQIILDTSHALLQSALSKKKLVSQNKEAYPIKLIEAENVEAEIRAAALDIKEKIKMGVDPNECAILVPKNRQVRAAMEVLWSEGIPIATLEMLNLFDQKEAGALLRVLKIIEKEDSVSLALSFFDVNAEIDPVLASKFIVSMNMREFSFKKLLQSPRSLFSGWDQVNKWIEKLSHWQKVSQETTLQNLLQTISRELLKDSKNKLVSEKEILNTFLFLLKREQLKNESINLAEFIRYLDKLESVGQDVPLVSSLRRGVKVLTMHSSKGLEFDYVWIAHMDEKSLAGGKKLGFALPENIKEVIEERDIDAIKRKLYVAITRAKRFCSLSYSSLSHKGDEQELAKVINDLPPQVFKKEKIKQEKVVEKESDFSKLIKLTQGKYADRYVSVSTLNNFFECPWKWYFENLLQLPKGEIEVFEFGIAVHAMIDSILKFVKIPNVKEVKNIITKEVQKHKFGNDKDRERTGREIFHIILSWVKNRLPEIKAIRKTEESISIKDKDYPHLKIYGRIDLIENLNAKEVRVTDFKTGKAKRKSEIEKLDDEGRMNGNLRQLAMYSYLLHENPKWQANVKESRLEFLEAKNKKESFYGRVVNNQDIELLKKDILDYDRLIKSGQWVKRECNYNSYGQNTECEYCKMAKIYSDL